MTTNEALGLIGALCKNIEKSAHESQHLPLDNFDLQQLNHFATKLQNIGFEFNRFKAKLNEKYVEEAPEMDEKTSASIDVLRRMRHFNGHG